MADKTTTLKTKTNDNVYPNVIGDNRDNAIVNSAHINHTLTADHKINFRLDTNISNLIFNSLQKPAGLTKTKLVGVGTNGQENIEIGNNLTLANGKLSASGGGGTHAWTIVKYLYPNIAAKEYSIGEEINLGDTAYLKLDGSELSVMMHDPAIFKVDDVIFTWTIVFIRNEVKALVYCIKPGTVIHATSYTLKIVANKQE